MASVGIIAEYNPFHNGHMYHINKIKELYKDDTIILILGGNFTERGDVSIIDKWKKTDIALKAGVDLVIELPYSFSTQSADYFSYGAVTLLENLKVEKLIFGSESNNIEDLKLIAKEQIENEEFDRLVKIYSKLGKNYPTALSLALYDLTGKEIKEPNDLLGISYIKTILKNNYKIEPISIKRTNNYHNEDLEEKISSATSIRKALLENIDVSNQVPDFVLPYLNNLHNIEDYFPLLKYKIITEKDLSIYHTVDEGIDKLLKKEILNANSYEELISKIKTKRYTYNKIKRTLLHILCNFTKEEANKYKDVEYIRILGFNDKGRTYLNKIKKETTLPIISKIIREKPDMLEFEMNTTKIYSLPKNEQDLIKKEYKNNLYKGDKYDKE
ncbi:MAG: nucleotidyltransferase [Firmicutes bacterium]|nr:nucleotidyltransferase [Bacillota bacterium]